MTTKNLEQMRHDIDNIDAQITDLFKQRMETSLEIAKYKKENAVPVLSDSREKEIMHKISEQIGEPFDGYARLFSTPADHARTTISQGSQTWLTGSKPHSSRLRSFSLKKR